jgi:hypothetical protein
LASTEIEALSICSPSRMVSSLIVTDLGKFIAIFLNKRWQAWVVSTTLDCHRKCGRRRVSGNHSVSIRRRAVSDRDKTGADLFDAVQHVLA